MRPALCVAALHWVVGVLAAQQLGTVAGKVTASEANTPLAGASVIVVGTARSAVTNERGEYQIHVTPGEYVVRARLIGYQSVEKRVTVGAGATATADFQLATSALQINEVVVVGSRTERSASETPVPVDVISAAELQQTGQGEVNQMLRSLEPSFNASHQTIADGTDHINPASLRGLGPDQVLVLLNGKRRHPSALVNVNGTFGRGTVGVDLNALPSAAIERIEVLRDGAAAQYGSDAIAGVINVVLKEQADRLDVTSTVGTTPGGGPFSDMADKHDGDQVKTDLNYGFRLGDRGFVNLTGEYLDRGATNRAAPYSGNDIFRGVTTRTGTDSALAANGLTREDFTMRVGQAAATVGMAFFNTAVALSDNADFYAFGGVSHRDGDAGAFYRLPSQESQVVPQIFPYGFLPEIHTKLIDRALTAGVRGTMRGWDLDFSLTHGQNDLQYNIDHTVNASMGAASPTTFDAGRLAFGQTTGNLDLVRPINTHGALRSLSLVTGAEFRVENYRIVPGDPASWQFGIATDTGTVYERTSTGARKAPFSQGFPGLQPSNQVNRYRNSLGLYAGLESELTERLLADVAARYESYSDFGSTLNGKIAARLEVAPGVAVRGAASTGFRAPSLHQVWFNNVSTQFVVNPSTGLLDPRNVLTSNNESRVTKAFGVPDLTEETSVNVSAGLTWRPGDRFSFTADAYRIAIDGRIVFTSQFATNDPNLPIRLIVAQILAPFQNLGVTSAQFFTNSVDTKTTGLDLVAAYATGLGPGTLNVTASATFTTTEVERVNVAPAMAAAFLGANLDTLRARVLNREDQNRLEDALPRQKGSVSARYTLGRFSGLARATYYGDIRYLNPINPANDESFRAKTVFDLDLGYELANGLKLAIGGDNIFNTYPDQQRKAANISAGRFVYSRRVTQFGSNGGFYYARVALTL